MPVLSRFFGIAIYMYWRDHAPPHFHARYQDDEVTVEIATGAVTGRMSRRALGLIEEWRAIHEEELIEDWRRAIGKEPLNPIEPLE